MLIFEKTNIEKRIDFQRKEGFKKFLERLILTLWL
jgi:hypothetical protein